jgi:ribosomal protein S18 acetylase RimI-like enzyme
MAGTGGLPMKAATYRDATAADAEAVGAIFDTVFRETFGHLYRVEDLETFMSAYTRDVWKQQLGDPAFAVRIAEVDGKAAGYAKLGPLKLDVQPNGPAMLLDQLYVLSGYHGSGIADALMEWTMNEARRRNSRALYLTVFIDNHRARRFYERAGFEKAGRYAFMVGNHADEDVIMRRAL